MMLPRNCINQHFVAELPEMKGYSFAARVWPSIYDHRAGPWQYHGERWRHSAGSQGR
jgi:hypothetical protein